MVSPEPEPIRANASPGPASTSAMKHTVNTP